MKILTNLFFLVVAGFSLRNSTHPKGCGYHWNKIIGDTNYEIPSH